MEKEIYYLPNYFTVIDHHSLCCANYCKQKQDVNSAVFSFNYSFITALF